MADLLINPPRLPLVAPSILSADFGFMIAECEDVLAKGGDMLHVDVMDGHFAANLTMGVDMIRGLRRHLPDAYLDVHLMVEHPDDYVEPFADAGANCFTFHIEVCDPNVESDGVDALKLIEQVHDRGMQAGIAVNPPTPIDWIEPVLEHVDMVLVMSVNPGRSGQAFMPQVLDKVRWCAPKLRDNQRLQMDGGIKPTNAGDCRAAGCDVLVAASAIFGADDRAAAIASIRG